MVHYGFEPLNYTSGKILIIIFFFLRQLLLCRVTLGKSFLQFSAMKMAHAPPGHHSVIGRPSVGGLFYPEYVVYRGEQVNIVYLLLHAFVNLNEGADDFVQRGTMYSFIGPELSLSISSDLIR